MTDKKKTVRFTWVDLCITVLLMTLAVIATWIAVSSVTAANDADRTVICRFTVTDIPEYANGKIKSGDILYLDDGSPLGMVKNVNYQRPDGKTTQLSLSLEAQTVREYGGYRAGDLLLTAGETYSLHTAAYGGKLLCVKITENGGE